MKKIALAFALVATLFAIGFSAQPAEAHNYGVGVYAVRAYTFQPAFAVRSFAYATYQPAALAVLPPVATYYPVPVQLAPPVVQAPADPCPPAQVAFAPAPQTYQLFAAPAYGFVSYSRPSTTVFTGFRVNHHAIDHVSFTGLRAKAVVLAPARAVERTVIRGPLGGKIVRERVIR